MLNRSTNVISAAALAMMPGPAFAVTWLEPNTYVEPITLESASLPVANDNRPVYANTGRPAAQESALGMSFAALRTLKPGWDGPNSVAIDELVLGRASHTLSQALTGSGVSAPAVIPCADGSLQAEWYDRESRFEIYFETDGSVSAWLQYRKSGREFEAEGDAAVELLDRWVAIRAMWPSATASA